MENKLESFYNANFYKAQKAGSLKSATEVLKIVSNFVHPRSVVDIDCGVGGWLTVWEKVIGGYYNLWR